MKTKTFLALSLVLAGTSAHAAPSCLKLVSDSDLLAEVSNRMNSHTTPADSALASFSCRFQTLTVSLVNPQTGAEAKEDLQLTDASSCSQLETSLSSKIGNKTLMNPALIAGCRFNTLMRVSLSPNGTLAHLQDQQMTDAASCGAARDRINDAL